MSDPDAPMQYAPTVLDGDRDWTRVELITTPSPGGGNASVSS